MKGRAPVNMACPDCGYLMTKAYKGWLCPNGECSLIRVRGHPLWGRVERVYREARPRLRPLSREELRTLLEPYLTPSVLKQLRARESITA